MEKKIILVTGATSGLGIEDAKAFAKQGYTVIIHGRNKSKAEAVKEQLIKETGNRNIDYLIADLLSLNEVRKMADEFKAKYDHLDVLVNNAGNQFGKTWVATKDGHEKTMTVNLFAPVLLSLLLVDELAKSRDGRIVTVSSASHAQGGRPYLDDIELKEHYSYMKVYGVSKLYVIWAMRHLKKELEMRGIKNISVNCTHPGSAKTNLGESDQRPFLMKLLFFAWQPLMTSVEKGAESTIYAATSNEIKGISNKYYGPKGEEKVNERYYSEQNEKIVWDYCMKVIKPYLE